MIQTFGEEAILTSLVFLITDLVRFFNFNRTMTGVQIGQTAELMVEKYPHLTAEDFIICFKNIKMLKYGKLFEGIDGAKIIDCIDQYEIHTGAEIAQHYKNIRDKKRREQEDDIKNWHPAVTDAIKSIVDKKRIQEPTPQTIKKEKASAEQRVQQWMKQFDKLWLKYAVGDNGIRLIRRYGKVLTVENYLKYKMAQYKRIHEI